MQDDFRILFVSLHKNWGVCAFADHPNLFNVKKEAKFV